MIFGSFDGMTSTLCVVAGLLATDATAPKILAAGVIGHYRGYAVTYLILIVVSVITVGLSIAVA